MCFSLAWIENIFIWLIVIGAVVALVKLLLPLVLSWAGTAGSVVMQALTIVMYAFICIVVVIFVFDLISCLMAHGGVSLPHLH